MPESKGSWIAPVSNAGAGIFSTIFGGRERRKAWERSVAHEQKVWERDTAYNHPAAQMARFKEAGLNPNLMYGQGEPGLASGKPMQSESFFPEQTVQSTFGDMAQYLMLSRQMDLIEAQTQKIRVETESESEKASRLRQDIEHLSQYNPLLRRKLEHEQYVSGRTLDSDVDARRARARMAEVQVENEIKRSGLLDQDGLIKRELLRTNKFNNLLLELETKFVGDGELTFGQILRMLLSKVRAR